MGILRQTCELTIILAVTASAFVACSSGTQISSSGGAEPNVFVPGEPVDDAGSQADGSQVHDGAAPQGCSICPKGCFELATDAKNCGSCGFACGAGTVCTDGKCATSGCSEVCAAGSTCVKGRCIVKCIDYDRYKQPGEKCGTECAHTDVDPYHCGDCAKDCTLTSPTGMYSGCSAGACTSYFMRYANCPNPSTAANCETDCAAVCQKYGKTCVALQQSRNGGLAAGRAEYGVNGSSICHLSLPCNGTPTPTFGNSDNRCAPTTAITKLVCSCQ